VVRNYVCEGGMERTTDGDYICPMHR